MDQAIVRGSELLKQGKLAEAQRAFHGALEIDRESTKVLALLGLAYFRANQFEEARPIYEELVERASTDAAHRLNLGLVYLKLGQGDHAINALEASRALDPSQGRAVSYLGLAYARAGRYAEAYRSFLLAGQLELAAEIEVNLSQADRDAINAQLGRAAAAAPPPADSQPEITISNRPTIPVAQLPPEEAPTPIDRHSATTAPIPVISVPSAAPAPAPAPVPASGRQPRAVTQNVVPRSKAPSVPPAARPDDPPAAQPPARSSAPEITVVTPKDASGRPADDGVAIISIGPPPRMTDSQQFVLPNRKADDEAVPRPEPGHSMVSMAVEAAVPAPTSPARTAAGGRPPRPLSELATEELVRPDEGDDRFEIGPTGNLVIRVVDRMLVRLEGVHVTGGELTYELATRRTRGHQTEERFDHGGATLHVVSGKGYLIATPGRHTFEAVVLDDDILYLREDLVFAFESSLRWENGNVPGLRGRLPVVQFRGDGALALRLERPLVRVKLPPQGMVYVDAERLAGWIGRVIPRAVVPPTGGPMGAMCVECTGEGVVLVEPAAPEARAAAAPEAPPPPPPPPPPSEAQPAIIPELADLGDDDALR